MYISDAPFQSGQEGLDTYLKSIIVLASIHF